MRRVTCALGIVASAANRSWAQLPTASAIRQKAEEVVARPDYQLDSALSESGRAWWLTLLRWILAPFRWLFEAMEGMPDVLRWVVVIVLAAVCVALIAHIVWSLVVAIRGPRRRAPRAADRRPDRHVDPAELVRQAESRQAAGDFIEAVRLLFRASLMRLERLEERKFRPGITNRALLARYRSSPFCDPLSRFVETIDSKWYGDEACRELDYVACRQEHDRLQALILERRRAVGA
jgi:hypothetical protein